jgi:hypothetical protein
MLKITTQNEGCVSLSHTSIQLYACGGGEGERERDAALMPATQASFERFWPEE